MSLPRNVLATHHIEGERQFWSMSEMVFKHHKGESIAVGAGFMSDGLSIPKIFQNVFSKSPHFIYAGILHDFIYREDFRVAAVTRKVADKLFLHYMQQYGVGWFTRHMIYRAVRIGGWAAWKKAKAKFYP